LNRKPPHRLTIRVDHARILGKNPFQDQEGHTEPLLTSHPGQEILLAWTSPQVVSSAFPGRLVPWKQVAGATGAEPKLCAPQPIVQQSFHLRRLDRRFSNVPTRSAGRDSFAPTA
jgi:hypothetical protein